MFISALAYNCRVLRGVVTFGCEAAEAAWAARPVKGVASVGNVRHAHPLVWACHPGRASISHAEIRDCTLCSALARNEPVHAARAWPDGISH
jgi:hypothetical protein